ncbi:hypothetical protein BCR43DRAFT_343238 [Syncephalastrum racemosum]|uniref:Uncharacterized protein n=1 Tax=Syncephalastrum racemosum TaxID=13706 RepID=A0A1X2H957_SYNRA|nr:hypothetical protein BCR43DRAFT_343238 [Syncephalastrum racemosum]
MRSAASYKKSSLSFFLLLLFVLLLFDTSSSSSYTRICLFHNFLCDLASLFILMLLSLPIPTERPFSLPFIDPFLLFLSFHSFFVYVCLYPRFSITQPYICFPNKSGRTASPQTCLCHLKIRT